MDGIHKSIFLWGLITLIGFGIYQGFISMMEYPPLIVWSVLVVIGIAGMVLWVPHWMKNKVVHVWLVINIVGMIYHWLFALQMVPAVIVDPWAYWAVVMALGFIGTGYFWKSNFYYGVGVLNILAFLVFVFVPASSIAYGSALLAIVGGIPTMYDGLKG